MYVAATGRRRGFARAVLARLESTARDAGADVMVLETGTAQPEAIALYTTQGYQPIEKFGHYAWSPQSRSFGKRL
jgi:ribosomal protein S18 acetylase RimI-like enzyme